jgi:hypothetical protein
MRALHEPRRIVEYHDRSATPFWLAFIPPHTDAQALIMSGISSDQQCPPSDHTTLAVGRAGRTECVALSGMFTSDLRAVHKTAGAGVRITVDLDLKGCRIMDLR